MNCYFVYLDKNQERWPFSLRCKFTSFSCLQKHLPCFHFKTMWYHLCFLLPPNHVKPLKNWSCYGILLIFDQLVGCDSWYGRVKEHTWLIVQPWKGLNSTTNYHLEKSLNLVLVFEKYLTSLLGHKKCLKFTTLSTPDTFFFKIRLIFAEENSAHPWCKN